MASPLALTDPLTTTLSLVKAQASTETSGTTSTKSYNELYEGCIQARDELLQTANKYRRKAKQPPIQVGEITQQSWNELDEGVQAACRDLEQLAAEEKKPANTSIGRVRQAFRSLCRHAGAGQTLVSLVPGDIFGFSSVLCAGFKLVFSAMHATALYRDVMFRALEELPCLLQDSSELCNSIVFGDDGGLHRRRAGLFTAVFDALRHIMLWFVKNSFVTSIKLVADPTGFAERLKERMDDVRIKSQQFWLQATKLSLFLQAQTATLQQITAQDVQTIATRTGLIELESRKTTAAIVDMLHKLDTIPTQTNTTADNFLNSLLNSLPRHLLQPPPHPPLPPATPININALLHDFCHDPSMTPRDTASILKVLRPSHRQSSSPKDFEQERVLAIQSSPRLRAWLVLNRPSLLLLNGRTTSQPRSEVSLVCAKIATRLLEIHESQQGQVGQDWGHVRMPFIIPLVFFCGQHRGGNDPNGTASELGMSLLLQLVDRGRRVMALGDDLVVGERFRELLGRPEDIGAICGLLEMVLGKLRGNVFVVVIVDGLRFFMQPAERERETRELVSRLVRVFRGGQAGGGGATLKMLFASTARLETLEYLFEEDEVLHMQRVVPDVRSDNDARWRRPMELKMEMG